MDNVMISACLLGFNWYKIGDFGAAQQLNKRQKRYSSLYGTYEYLHVDLFEKYYYKLLSISDILCDHCHLRNVDFQAFEAYDMTEDIDTYIYAEGDTFIGPDPLYGVPLPLRLATARPLLRAGNGPASHQLHPKTQSDSAEQRTMSFSQIQKCHNKIQNKWIKIIKLYTFFFYLNIKGCSRCSASLLFYVILVFRYTNISFLKKIKSYL